MFPPNASKYYIPIFVSVSQVATLQIFQMKILPLPILQIQPILNLDSWSESLNGVSWDNIWKVSLHGRGTVWQ
jgi:hypothetical protein